MGSDIVRAGDVSPGLTIRTVADAVTVAERLAGSSMIPSYIRSKEDALYILLTGAELGLGPAASFRGLFSIQGQVGMKYQLVGARLRQYGWRIQWLTDSTDMTRATVRLTRDGEEPHDESYTIEQAKRAGLTRNKQWEARPERMLRARALVGAADAVDGRIRMGLYAEDEVAEIVGSRPEPQRSAVRVVERPRVVEPAPAAAESAPEEDVSDGEIVCASPETDQPGGKAPGLMSEQRTAEELEAWLRSGWGAEIAERGKLAVVLGHADRIGVTHGDVRRWCGVDEAAE